MGAVIGIDLGSSCGWAVASEGRLTSGAWRLKPGAKSSDQTRELIFWRRLEATRELYGVPELVAYEEVVAHGRGEQKQVECPGCHNRHSIRVQATNVLAAQVYGALRGVLQMWCDWHGVRVAGVAVGTLKLFATGNGRASKDDMVAWAQMRWPEQQVKDHDQADALHVLDWGLVEVLNRRGKAHVDRGGQLQLEPQPQDVEF